MQSEKVGRSAPARITSLSARYSKKTKTVMAQTCRNGASETTRVADCGASLRQRNPFTGFSTGRSREIRRKKRIFLQKPGLPPGAGRFPAAVH